MQFKKNIVDCATCAIYEQGPKLVSGNLRVLEISIKFWVYNFNTLAFCMEMALRSFLRFSINTFSRRLHGNKIFKMKKVKITYKPIIFRIRCQNKLSSIFHTSPHIFSDVPWPITQEKLLHYLQSILHCSPLFQVKIVLEINQLQHNW